MHEDSPKIIAENSIGDPYRPEFSILMPVLPKKKQEIVEIITRPSAEMRPSDFSMRFLT